MIDERDIGRLEAKVEALCSAVQQINERGTRIEEKIDQSLNDHDMRLRDVEGEVKVLRRLGTIVGVLWASIVAGVAYLFRSQS